MKNYEKPEIEVVSIEVEENLTSSYPVTGGVGGGGRPGPGRGSSADDDEF